MTKVNYYGHGTFGFETAGKKIVIDPFFTGNPKASLAADDLQADVLIVSHGHSDHIGDCVEIAKRTGALVVSNFEIIQWIQNQGIENAHPMHIGGSHDFEFGTVKLTMAMHGSMMPDGAYGGNPCGILLKLKDCTIYHAADTGLFFDMKLIGEEGIDLAILPICDNFTMGPDDAIRALQYLNPTKVIPSHYNTWPVIEQDPHVWAREVKAKTASAPIVLAPGESCTIGE